MREHLACDAGLSPRSHGDASRQPPAASGSGPAGQGRQGTGYIANPRTCNDDRLLRIAASASTLRARRYRSRQRPDIGAGRLYRSHMIPVEAVVENRKRMDPIIKIGDAYVGQILGISEFVVLISPTVRDIEEKLGFEILDRIRQSLDPSLRDDFVDSIRNVGNAVIEFVGEIESRRAKGDLSNLSKTVQIDPFVQHAVSDSTKRIARQVQFGSKAELLRRSVLVTSVSSFERLFGEIAREILRINKSALDESGQSFTLQDLLGFETIDDARELIIERRIAALIHDSIDGWDAWLKKATKNVQMKELPLDWPTAREVFARRNIAVHSDCTVNALYLKALADTAGRSTPWAKTSALAKPT